MVTDFTTWVLVIFDQNNKSVPFMMVVFSGEGLEWIVKRLAKPSFYVALCNSNNFKLRFDKIEVRSIKIYEGENCRELNSLSNHSSTSSIGGQI